MSAWNVVLVIPTVPLDLPCGFARVSGACAFFEKKKHRETELFNILAPAIGDLHHESHTSESYRLRSCMQFCRFRQRWGELTDSGEIYRVRRFLRPSVSGTLY